MKTRSKQRFRGSIFILAINVVMIAVSLFALHQRTLDSLKPSESMNAGMDLMAMILGFFILLFSLIDHKRTEEDYRSYCMIVEMTFLGLFTDVLAWSMNGVPEVRFWYLLVNTVFYLCMPIGLYCFWRYVLQIIGKNDPWVKRADIFIKIGFAAEVAACVINISAGFFFVVDATGTYQRGPFFILFMLYIGVVGILIAVLLVVRRKRLQKRQIVVLAVYLLTPLPVILLSVFVYGMSLNYIAAMVDLLLMYGALNVEQGREKMAVKQELATATQIQQDMLPRIFPIYPDRKEFEVFAHMDPAREVGGDFYDIFLLDEDHLALVMADVAGKGIPASLFMVVSKTMIKNRALMGGTPSEILRDVNARMCEGKGSAMFVTVWLGIVTLSTGEVTETNAGHENPVLIRNGTCEILKRPHDFVLGGLKKAKFHEDSFVLNPGDMLFIYTDGLPEASNAEGKRYEMERVREALSRYQDAGPEELLSGVRREVDSFVGEADQFDDLTMMAFLYRGPAR